MSSGFLTANQTRNQLIDTSSLKKSINVIGVSNSECIKVERKSPVKVFMMIP